MRLIDADGVKKDLLAELLMGVDGGTDASYLKTYEVIDRIEKIVNEWVDNQITVEAIPIEWIKRYASEKSYNDGMDCYWHFWEEDILKMLEDWKEENEIDRC